MKKLELKKGIVARLNSNHLEGIKGGLNNTKNNDCLIDETNNTMIGQCMTVTCNTGNQCQSVIDCPSLGCASNVCGTGYCQASVDCGSLTALLSLLKLC